jgi:hypothetical protein
MGTDLQGSGRGVFEAFSLNLPGETGKFDGKH